MAQETFRHLRGGKSKLKEIIFCLYDQEAYEIFEKGVLGYLRHVTEDLGFGPFVTVDAIIEIGESIVVIERSNPPFGLALPGGFIDYGESLEEAVRREVKEETGLEVTELKQFHTYSDPERDPRFQTIGTVFIAKTKGTPKAGDDAAGIRMIKKDEILKHDFAFDHKKIIQDYFLALP
jgi:ADP-ribose pyrophosphatase YjhB (NUDIX family)